MLREYAQLGEGVTVRPWQSLRFDPSWQEDLDRAFPLIEVRCSGPSTDSNQSTLFVSVKLLCGTKTDDDKDHAAISAMYESVESMCARLFSQFRQTEGVEVELAAFKAFMLGNTDAGAFQFGGLTFGESIDPYDDRGCNMMGITMGVHYGRSDF